MRYACPGTILSVILQSEKALLGLLGLLVLLSLVPQDRRVPHPLSIFD